jgi:hypothetical protein
MINTSDETIMEFSEEEVAVLMAFEARHRRWRMNIEESAVSRQHRIIADTLKDTVGTIQTLIEMLKSRE